MNVVVDGVVTMSLAAKSVAIVVPECPGLVYSLWITEDATHIVAKHVVHDSLLGRDSLVKLATYTTTDDALVHFKAVVVAAERRRRAEATLARMEAQLVAACATPLDDDADDGL